VNPETSHSSAQGVRGSRLSRWSEDMLQRNLHCSTYNIEHKQGCLESARPVKTSQQHAPWSSSSPPPSPQEKHPQPTQNVSPSRPPHHQCADPGADSLSSPHLRINYADLPEDSCPGTNKRPRVCAVKKTYLKPSCHRAGNNDQSFPTPYATRRVPVQWVRTTRSPVPKGRIPLGHFSFFFSLDKTFVLFWGAYHSVSTVPYPVQGSQVSASYHHNRETLKRARSCTLLSPQLSLSLIFTSQSLLAFVFSQY
jgi:hypothetical protein